MKISTLIMSALYLSCSTCVLADVASSKLTRDETLWLHVPIVEYLGIPGYFQNAHFMMNEDESWELISYETGVQLQSLTNVEVIETSEVPIQVFLEVDGYFPSLCREMGEIVVSRVENEFIVGMYRSEESIRLPEDSFCADAVAYFSELIQLPVYGLEAGEYTFSINDQLSGSFMLPDENVLPD
jgi:hypothetical protein